MRVKYTANEGARSRSCLTLAAAATTWRLALVATLVLAPKAQTVRMVVVDAIVVKECKEQAKLVAKV
jgi:hypothetical protein